MRAFAGMTGFLVMAGLVPAIHVLLCGQDVDARIRGHDGFVSSWPGMTLRVQRDRNLL
jgi:hypothetical protein